LLPVPAGLQVYGFSFVAMVALGMVQLHTSPPHTWPPPGQSVSLRQASPAANAVDAPNSAIEPTNVATEPRKKAFIRITSKEAVAQHTGGYLGMMIGLQFVILDRGFRAEMRSNRVPLGVDQVKVVLPTSSPKFLATMSRLMDWLNLVETAEVDAQEAIHETPTDRCRR
jgi:hypothetical protein